MNEIIIRVVNVHCFTSMGNGSISLAQIGSMPHRTEARGKPEMPSNRLPIVSFFVDCVISSPFSFDCRGDGSGGVDGSLCRIHGTRNIGLCRGVQAKAAGDAGHLSRREHQSHAHECVILEHHESRD